jgi:maleate cis-trans isomerase
MTTVGLLYPGFGAEDDFPELERRWAVSPHPPEVTLRLAHTSVGEDAHRVDALRDLGGPDRLAAGVRELADRGPMDSVMWACTSGSFVFGWDGARDQVDVLSRELQLPVSSTSIAFVNAVHALGITRVGVAASYPQDVAARFFEFLDKGGIDVIGTASHGILTAAEVGLLDHDDVVSLVQTVDTAEVDALLIPDTAMHSLAWLDDLEVAAGKPVLTANQVTVWEGLNLLGAVPRLEGMGSLFFA